ncbi:MAG: WbqC family protein, partial [Chloroflexota bacterium]
KTENGTRWLSIPVSTSEGFPFPINAAQVKDSHWAKEHWKTLRHTYARTPYFATYEDHFADVYAQLAEETHLSQINYRLITAIRDVLKITTPLHWDTEFDLPEDRTAKFIHLCQQTGADTYLSGPSAQNYMDMAQFAAAGIEVRWMRYEGYPEYDQLHPPFEHSVTVLDTIFCTGPDAPQYICSAQ